MRELLLVIGVRRVWRAVRWRVRRVWRAVRWRVRRVWRAVCRVWRAVRWRVRRVWRAVCRWVFRVWRAVRWRVRRVWRAVRRRERQANELVLVITMGRVGSSATYRALERAGFEALHIHQIDLKSLVQRSQKLKVARHIKDGHRARALLDAEPDRPVKVITLVRDPIEQNISAGFSRFRRLGKLEELRRYVTDPAVMRPIWEKSRLAYPLGWMDLELRDALGIDFYQVDVASTGYGQMEVGRVKALLLHSTLPDEVKSAHLSRFMGRDCAVGRTGKDTSKQGDLQNLYRAFELTSPLTVADLSEAAESRFVQHFFAVDKDEYVAKWKTRLNLA
ncbi:MAG: hypothetical protein NTW34_06130 [Actinobacteria bacterium]|nr:hypothetical protein [Actinomycetota bacterium]